MDNIKQYAQRSYQKLDNIFTDEEAWTFFRTSALLETVGWTLLITGIVFSIQKWPFYDWVLPIAGSLHGIFVIAYMLIVLFAHRSLNWGVWRFAIAEIVSIVPYGALVFEVYESNRRRVRYALAVAAVADSSGRPGFQSQ